MKKNDNAAMFVFFLLIYRTHFDVAMQFCLNFNERISIFFNKKRKFVESTTAATFKKK